MPLSKQLDIQRLSWFWIGMVGIFLLSVGLRFWGLSRFNTLVFDEVYYARFANNYLSHTPFFDGHPPLSKYIIAVGMWIGSHLPFGQDAVNSLSGSLHSTWSYRWLNALTGSFIPLVVAGIAYQLSYRHSYALIAALFAAADGLFLVESRYALNNVYLVIFGLLGQWFLFLALDRRGSQRWLWLTLSGIGFGACAAIKWNGLWFLLGAYLIWLAAWVIRSLQSRQTADLNLGEITTPMQKLTQLHIGQVLFYLAIIPTLVYSVAWIPHLQQNPTPGFIEVHKQILSYHERVGDGPKVHPYCSHWYTWILMIRPVAYFYQLAQTATEPIAVVGPPLPPGVGKVVYDIHAMGNPFLWWFSTAAILLLVWQIYQNIWVNPAPGVKVSRFTNDSWIALYLLLNWLANLLPWVKVTRCTFIYHYMGASVFAFLALALIVDQYLHSYRSTLRVIGVTIIFIVLLAFVFWMPIYLGLPLSPESYRLRMWFPSWI